MTSKWLLLSEEQVIALTILLKSEIDAVREMGMERMAPIKDYEQILERLGLELPIPVEPVETSLLDSDDYETEEVEYDYNGILSDLGSFVKEYVKSANLLIESNQVDWTGRPGCRVIEDIQDMSDEKLGELIYPSYECHLCLYAKGYDLFARVSSHDIPTGATWNFKSYEVEEDEDNE